MQSTETPANLLKKDTRSIECLVSSVRAVVTGPAHETLTATQ